MRRRRKFKGLWLPNIGTVDVDGDNIAITAGREVEIAASGGETKPVVGVIPLTFDQPQEAQTLVDNVPLIYQLGNGYTLRRVVGKFYAQYTPGVTFTTTQGNTQGHTPPAVLLTAGLFVARAEDENIAANLPIGSLSGDSLIENYNPDTPNCIREPWLWRRKWILGNPLMRQFADVNYSTLATPINPDIASAYYPPNTGSYGSVWDGPHCDARTRRRVSSDDRLWLAVSLLAYPRRSGGYTNPSQVNIHFDYRLFGALRRDRNRGVF